MEIIKSFVLDLVWLFNEMSPYLLLGFFIAGCLHVFLPPGKMTKWLGKPNLKSAVYAAFLGVPLPLCSCGVIPTGVSLYSNGSSKGASISFLISTPQTGVDSILVTYSLMTLPFALIRPVVAFVSGIVGGALTNSLTQKEPAKTQESQITEPVYKNKWAELFRYAFVEFLEDIAKWLVIGLLVAALITTLVPDDFFTQYLTNSWVSMLVILLASIPMYVCATGSVPIAAALMLKGLSPGAAFVFLMAGPATNAGTIAVIGKSLGKKSLYAYLISIIGMSIAAGAIIDLALPASWFEILNPHAANHHASHIIPEWIQWTSSGILVALMLNIYRKKWFGKKSNTHSHDSINSDMNAHIKVEGMTCNHCKASVENNLKSLPFIDEVQVDLSSGEVSLKGENIDFKEVEDKVSGLGYLYKGKL